jgi:hypothetical protein
LINSMIALRALVFYTYIEQWSPPILIVKLIS